MKEYTFTELGYFTANSIAGIKKAMQGRTYMNFDVKASNIAGNHVLIIRTDYDASEEEIKGMFLNAALSELACVYRVYAGE